MLLLGAAMCQLLYVLAQALALPPPVPQVLNAVARFVCAFLSAACVVRNACLDHGVRRGWRPACHITHWAGAADCRTRRHPYRLCPPVPSLPSSTGSALPALLGNCP